jgi:hypothetical protein
VFQAEPGFRFPKHVSNASGACWSPRARVPINGPVMPDTPPTADSFVALPGLRHYAGADRDASRVYSYRYFMSRPLSIGPRKQNESIGAGARRRRILTISAERKESSLNIDSGAGERRPAG